MAFKVFIDGREGTTGLQLHQRLQGRRDIQLLSIDEALRKDPSARKDCINSADVVFLCLPDDAARESVSLVENDSVRVIDASTAHRTAPGWAYGFPELSIAHREAIKHGKRIANPGCYATGMLSCVYPLIALGIMGTDYPVVCQGISGYSGAGKKTIALYEATDRPAELESPRHYALSLHHKHLPEMQQVTGLDSPPLFNPIICDFYAGMAVSVPLHVKLLKQQVTLKKLYEALSDFYSGSNFISVHTAPEAGFLPANELTGTNRLKLYVCGNDSQMTLISVLDNLGKGASGAAVQNMNIALGLDETTGLI